MQTELLEHAGGDLGERGTATPGRENEGSIIGFCFIRLRDMVRSLPMQQSSCRTLLRDYILANALPPDKFSHQARLYRLATELAAMEGRPYDDDVLYAGAWLHDLGVFIGHRPEELEALARWDHVAYVLAQAPGLLAEHGFPREKIPAVLEVIRTHMPKDRPTSFEGVLLRDADILEQLGAVAILRTVSKVGRDTRFRLFSDALHVLSGGLEQLPGRLALEASRTLAKPRIQALETFLESARAEAGETPW